MFSSPLGGRRKDSIKDVPVPRRDTSSIEDPIEEFNYLFDRLGCLLDMSKEAFVESLKEPTSEKSSLGFFRRARKKDNETDGKAEGEGSEEMNVASPRSTTPPRRKSAEQSEKPPSTPPPASTSRRSKNRGDATFVPIIEEDECVEVIRRLAELVIIGERVVATQMEREDKLFVERLAYAEVDRHSAFRTSFRHFLHPPEKIMSYGIFIPWVFHPLTGRLWS